MYVENIGNEGAVQLNVEAMAAYKAQIMAASERLGIPEPSDWYSVLLRFSDTVKGEAVAELSDDERAAILDGVSRAVEQLMEYRAVEGKKLDDFFRCRIARITELLAEVPAYESERVAKIIRAHRGGAEVYTSGAVRQGTPGAGDDFLHREA